MEEVFGILVLVIVIPLWLILHYATALKKSKSLTKGDEQMLEELWNLSQKMEERIETLEVILDRENKGWSK
jgi:phage shock protein B